MSQLTLFTNMNTEKENVTLKQRIWETIRGEPGATAKRIQAILSEDNTNSVNPALSVMEKQGYVYSYGRGTKNNPKRWYTDYDTFKPLDEMGNLAEDRNCKKVMPHLVSKKVVIPQRPTLHNPMAGGLSLGLAEKGQRESIIDSFVNNLTMGECTALYKRLHAYFGMVNSK